MTTEPIPNPISLDAGPDLNVRTFLHDWFEQNRETAGFSLEDWKDWPDSAVAGVVRALALDYLEGHGSGFDWVTASYQAEFFLAGTYHEVAFDAAIDPAPRLTLNFYDPYLREGLELQMEPPSDIAMDPVPGLPAPPSPTESRRARSPLMVPPAGNAQQAVDQALVTGARQLSEFFQVTNRLPLQFMGAALTLWRGLQASHHIRGGAVYRGIRNPSRPVVPEGSMRLVYARTGDHIMAAVAANPAEASLFLD